MARYPQTAGFAGNVSARQDRGKHAPIEPHPHLGPPLEGEDENHLLNIANATAEDCQFIC
jgi:hypothetical protein